MTARAVALLSLLAAVGCDGAAEPRRWTAQLSASVPRPPCGELERLELQSWLKRVCSEPTVADTRMLALVRWTGEDEIAESVSIAVTSEGPALDGELLDDVAFGVRLHDVMQRRREMAATAHEELAPGFVLAVHRDARLRDVAETTRALAELGILRGVLVFGSATSPRTPPPREPQSYAKAMAELELAPANDKAVFLARTVEQFAERCPSMNAALGRLESPPTRPRHVALAEEVARGLVECGCPPWQPELLTWLQVLCGPADAAVPVANAIELTPGKGERVAPDTTWAAYVATLDAPPRTFWLEAAP